MTAPLPALRAAVAYFTVLPVGDGTPPPAAALAWLPLIGVGIGLAAGVAGRVAPHDAPLLRGAVAFTAATLLTGALHLDGFLDCCDAAFAPVAPERRLAILADPHHGSFALAGLACVVPLWIGAAAAIPPASLAPTLGFALGWARFAALLRADRAAAARETAAGTIGAARWASSAIGLGATAALALAGRSPRRLVASAFATAASLGAAVALERRLGALRGDAYGALIVAGETLLLVLAALAAEPSGPATS